MGSMKSLLGHLDPNKTPQSEPLTPDQVPNSAGGFVWAVDPWQRLTRFLILGTTGGSYYASEKALTKENVLAMLDLVQLDGLRVVHTIVDVSSAGRAPKNEPAILLLALCAKKGSPATQRAAYAAMPLVCRIGTHLFQFVAAIKMFGGVSSGTQRALSRWYQTSTGDDLAYQLVKYQSREKWSHRDVLRLAKPGSASRKVPFRSAATDAALTWATKGTVNADTPRLIQAFEQAKALTGRADDRAVVQQIVDLINETNLPRECVPTDFLNSAEVWEALLQRMPMTAMIRNLGKMSSVGLIRPLSAASLKVANALADEATLVRARVHPLALLVALTTYARGSGVKGSLHWEPDTTVLGALDKAFYLAFRHVRPSNKRLLLALDVSGSMECGEISGLPGITPRVGSAAMAMVTAAAEPQHHFVGFSHQLVPLSIRTGQTLEQVTKYIGRVPMGRTDCAAPMEYARTRKIEVDTFVVYTDNETWHGHLHPARALKNYRQAMGIDAKLVVVGMVANNFTIADPSDSGMLDVVGFDTAAPDMISAFSRGEL